MADHPSDDELSTLHSSITELRGRMAASDMAPDASESIARSLSRLATDTLRTVDAHSWSPSGWHLTHLLGVLRALATATREFVNLPSNGEDEAGSASETEDLAIVLVELLARLPGPLRQLGTDIWVDLYTALGEVIKVNWWNNELTNRLQAKACSILSAIPDAEESIEFRDMMKHSFGQADLSFRCL